MSPVRISGAVEQALGAGRPVVALESTVIAHGLPWPENLRLAHRLEAAITERGATPATIAVLSGEVRVGLAPSELERIARGPKVIKVSRRDVPVAIARRLDGATTVAGTMLIADRAGIRVMATGGIGGVHRGAGRDVSADLPELARTPVTVVCSGAKAILDLPATLEWLETGGVPVIGYQTDAFPAFYVRDSGLTVPVRAETPAAVGAIIKAKTRFGIAGGLVVAVPCPLAKALDAAVAESAVARALEAAAVHGIRGPALTPFLLARVVELTGGAARDANLALLEHNAGIAADIAVALGQEAG